ncbi:MAG: hypothetical protein GXO77_09625 [Calditrichaeota bacterium]|nr:hypothetical protein [Calditrichota bacterium]
MPKIKARFRKYHGIPFSIEQFTGVQYRCRVCNNIFLDKKEFTQHLQSELKQKSSPKISKKCPKPNQNITARVLYVIDIHDLIHRDYLKLPDGVTYDSEI